MKPQDDTAGMIKLATGASIRRAHLRFAFSRSSGPGGQAVNKIATRAQLRVRVSDIEGLSDAAAGRLRTLAGQRYIESADELLIESQTHRSQLANKQLCIEKLQQLAQQAMVRPRKRKKTRPSRSAVERRLQSKRRAGDAKRRRTGPLE